MIWNILALSAIAGLGTGLGGLIAVARQPGRRAFGVLMGITAGVMITLSFVDLVNHALALAGVWLTTVGFAVGAFSMFLIDISIPHIRFGRKEFENPSDIETEERLAGLLKWRWKSQTRITDPGLLKTGLLVGLGIAIHNAPEGIAIGAGYMHTPAFGIFIATAITLHNIPEGIATALPLYKAGMSKRRAAFFALVSGLTEPFGALIAALALASFESLVPIALAFAGGVMVFITLDELIPTAREHGANNYTAVGIILGAVFVFLLSGILDG